MLEITMIDQLKSQYDDFEYYNGMNIVIVRKNSKIGVVDKELNILIPLIYETLYLVDFSTKRMIAQLNKTWLVINENNTILFKSKHNYDSNPKWKMNYFDSSYCYVPYYDGFIEHFKDKIVLITKEKREEFYLHSDSAMCIDTSPLIYFFDGEIKGYLDLNTGRIQLDVLIDVRNKKFTCLKAYDVDDILCAGEKPYSLFEQSRVIQELKDNGITTIINLMQKKEIQHNQAEISKEFKVLNIPIVKNGVPSIEVLYKIMHIIDSSEKTYIHCDLGIGRTDVVVAFYLYKKYGYQGNSGFCINQAVIALS